jgi:hypothetical protein
VTKADRQVVGDHTFDGVMGFGAQVTSIHIITAVTSGYRCRVAELGTPPPGASLRFRQLLGVLRTLLDGRP